MTGHIEVLPGVDGWYHVQFRRLSVAVHGEIPAHDLAKWLLGAPEMDRDTLYLAVRERMALGYDRTLVDAVRERMVERR